MNKRELVALACAVAGLALSTHLAAFQLRWITSPWDPVFGTASSEAVLRSSFSRALPVSDAALGAVGYATEAALATIVAVRPSEGTWRLYLAIATAAAAAGIALTMIQIIVVHHLCLLCLCSAALSVAVASLAASAYVTYRNPCPTQS